MAIHDWTRVPAGIFHHFHHDWITEISRALNDRVLPDDYYAMAEQQAAGFGPDVVTLQSREPAADAPRYGNRGSAPAATLIRPQARFTAQTEAEFYRRKKSAIAVRHVGAGKSTAVFRLQADGRVEVLTGLPDQGAGAYSVDYRVRGVDLGSLNFNARIPSPITGGAVTTSPTAVFQRKRPVSVSNA